MRDDKIKEIEKLVNEAIQYGEQFRDMVESADPQYLKYSIIEANYQLLSKAISSYQSALDEAKRIKYKVGKWYQYVGPENSYIFYKPQDSYECTSIEGNKVILKRGMIDTYVFISDEDFPHHFMKEIEDQTISDNQLHVSKKRNEYRSFSENDVGKSLTIREWDDMAEEFEVDAYGKIVFGDKDLYFIQRMRWFCGKKIDVCEIRMVNHMGNIVAVDMKTGMQFCPEMLEECIIK